MSDNRLRSPLRVGVVGCGDVADRYANALHRYPQLVLVGATDRNEDRARDLVSRYGGIAYTTLDDLLSDPGVDLVLNLTRQYQHAQVTRICLERGKHVYSEKPLAMNEADARSLVEFADRLGLKLACAPSVHLGDAQQLAAQAIRAGRIGRVRMVYADLNSGMIEAWHPRPVEFYDAGSMVDVGPYALTLLTSLLGPAVRVHAYGRVVLPERATRDGRSFSPKAPDTMVACVDFPDGVFARVTTSFYASGASGQQGVEFHGDDGMLRINGLYSSDALTAIVARDGERVALGARREPGAGIDFAHGVAELADAIVQARQHRCSGAHAAHVVAILAAMDESMRQECPIQVAPVTTQLAGAGSETW